MEDPDEPNNYYTAFNLIREALEKANTRPRLSAQSRKKRMDEIFKNHQEATRYLSLKREIFGDKKSSGDFIPDRDSDFDWNNYAKRFIRENIDQKSLSRATPTTEDLTL